jgi:hypothetical protein
MPGVWCSRPSHRVDQMGKDAAQVSSFFTQGAIADALGDAVSLNCVRPSTTIRGCDNDVGCRSPRLSPCSADSALMWRS